MIESNGHPRGECVDLGTHTHSATNALGECPARYFSDIQLDELQKFLVRRSRWRPAGGDVAEAGGDRVGVVTRGHVDRR